jgi:hypothetical protein
MATDQTKRTPALQLELPLPSGGDTGDGGPDPEWRLDEETRRLGRRGIASARARLAGRHGGSRGPAGGDRRTGAGRAA